MIYDIFGFSYQILEGADKLAEDFLVFMPDFFDGQPAPMDDWLFDDEAYEAKLDAFCNGPGETDKTVRRMLALRENLQQLYPSIKGLGLGRLLLARPLLGRLRESAALNS